MNVFLYLQVFFIMITYVVLDGLNGLNARVKKILHFWNGSFTINILFFSYQPTNEDLNNSYMFCEHQYEPLSSYMYP